jgi:hypothetical protein
LKALFSRLLELFVALLAFGLVGLSVWLIVDGARSGEITWAWTIANWGVAFICLLLIGAVFFLGLRVAFPALRTQGRVITRNGLLLCAVAWLCLLARAWIVDGRFPPGAIVPLVGIAAGWSFSRSRGSDA